MSEPGLGPGLTGWSVLLGNASLEISLQGSLPFHSLIKLIPRFSSLCPSHGPQPEKHRPLLLPGSSVMGVWVSAELSGGSWVPMILERTVENWRVSAIQHLSSFSKGFHTCYHIPLLLLWAPHLEMQAASPANPHTPRSLTDLGLGRAHRKHSTSAETKSLQGGMTCSR